MGWYGSWNLEYTGKNNQKFINTAKLVITNFRKRFEISDNNSELGAIKKLSWYSADMDIEKILSYLDDGDQIHVLIDGETHPIREVIREGGYVDKGVADENNYDYSETDLNTGVTKYYFQKEYIEPEYDYCDWEEQFYKKQDGKVTMECEYTDCDRYKSDRHGMKGAFIYELSYPDTARKETLEAGSTDTLDTYIEWIAGEMGDNEEMLPIIQSFMNEIMNISREEVIEENGEIDEEAFTYFNDIKAKFQSLESTKQYISEVKSKLPPKKEEEKLVVPELFANMSKSDINQLGGMEQVIKLYEKEGEAKTRELLSILGYDLNSGIKDKGKKKSSVQQEKETKQINGNIRDSVVNYFLGCVKAKYPNLTPENEKIFTKKLGRIVEEKLEYGGWNCSLNIDYDPCQELVSAFYSMDMANFDSGLPIYDVFPFKTYVRMEKGKCATVSSDYQKSGILYMTDEYRQELLTSVNTRIMREESKIPQETKDGFEQEYQTLMNALNVEREPLVKKQEETQKVLDQRKALKLKAQQLIESYASRVDELETLGLSESEKEQRKQAIIKEIKQVQEATTSDRFREQLGEIEEKYGWESLKEFDEEHKEDLDKEAWMKKRYVSYARDEYHKIWEQHEKEHPGEFSFPDTSSVPIDLDRLYEEREQIAEYDRQQEDKAKSQEGKEQPIKEITEQQKFAEALGNAYAQYMQEDGNIDEYSFRNNREQILADGFAKYFASNYENLTNSAFLIEFENGPMREIAKERGFRESTGIFGWGFRSETEVAHVNVSEGLIYTVEGFSDEVKIEYATPEAIQQQIDRLNSEVRFMQDSGEDSWSLKRIENQKRAFISYQRQLQGKQAIEPSLEELDQQKQMLEGLDAKSTQLLQQLDKNNENNKQGWEIEGIFIDD